MNNSRCYLHPELLIEQLNAALYTLDFIIQSSGRQVSTRVTTTPVTGTHCTHLLSDPLDRVHWQSLVVRCNDELEQVVPQDLKHHADV